MYTLHHQGVQGKCLRVIRTMYAGASSRIAYVLTMVIGYRCRPMSCTLMSLRAKQMWGLLRQASVCEESSMLCMPTPTAGNKMPMSQRATSPSSIHSPTCQRKRYLGHRWPIALRWPTVASHLCYRLLMNGSGMKELPVQLRSVEYTGIWFNDCTCTLQATAAQAKGRRAVHKWRPVFERSHRHVSLNVEALRS
jgi:hypothetical protein